ncbi:MAG: SDR family NAD(P)-dependent oxidoreductase, partial [Hyphomicrobiaceae bacterium]|nr:SDR family NAD(P)-dependent oxidoreductase [Hyphomicrobiaceae bacterium]
MDLKLNGKTAVVTGSTAGIGLEIARTLAIEGCDVVVSGRAKPKVDAAVAGIAASGGSHVRGVVADVTTAEGAASLIAAAGRVDILVNNLGIYESKAFGDIADADWLRFFDVNVVSGTRLAQAVFPGML